MNAIHIFQWNFSLINSCQFLIRNICYAPSYENSACILKLKGDWPLRSLIDIFILIVMSMLQTHTAFIETPSIDIPTRDKYILCELLLKHNICMITVLAVKRFKDTPASYLLAFNWNIRERVPSIWVIFVFYVAHICSVICWHERKLLHFYLRRSYDVATLELNCLSD